MLLKIQAAECGVAPKIIASSDDLEIIAAEDNPDAAPLRGWRAEVFGKDALDIKNGKLAIGLKGSAIAKFAISDLDKPS